MSKPGITAAIKNMLKEADAKHPISREELLEGLKELFPERNEEAMRRTINGQVSYHLKDIIKGTPKQGYWIP
jgi:hypothetical protein